MIFKGTRDDCSIIPFNEGHIHNTFAWVRETELSHLFLIRGEVTWDKHLDYFNRVLHDRTQHVYAIQVDNLHVGNCGLKNISNLKKEGELWIYIGESSMRNKGIGKCAVYQLLQIAFETLGLELIYLHIADYNIGALKFYEKLGFIRIPLENGDNEWSNRNCKIIKMELRKYKFEQMVSHNE